ncbi:hypothetical protein VKT23_004723 [Stygiomarasmius scandens]|uniref:Ankyrin repeat domain-containing protein n=1 Tax=Marasmiellus scandens TaxID=2682957 RepID=A0ABR1JVQ8_9AGAR
MLNLPPELLYEVQLYALSPSLPYVSKHLYQVFTNASISLRARYIFLRALGNQDDLPKDLYTRILRYPLCTIPVLHRIVRIIKQYDYSPLLQDAPELPRRFFRALPASSSWSDTDEPLPYLRVIFSPEEHFLDMDPPLPAPNPNSHHAYALTRAVLRGFVPLVDFLLSQGALPSYKNGLSVLVAIREKDVAMVKRLIERKDDSAIKKRKLPDRLIPTPNMLKMAVKVGAHDIIEYFMNEKGVVPDLKTLYLIRGTSSGR